MLDRAAKVGQLLPRLVEAHRRALGGPPRPESEYPDDRFDRMSKEELEEYLTGIEGGCRSAPG